MIVPTFAANQWPVDIFYERLDEQVEEEVWRREERGAVGLEAVPAIVRQEFLVNWLDYSIPAGNA